eukprot:Hpha_TRINITY_DN2124_c0_g1::TRINITY_DN2124_c0_g1_i1::g.42251::m.42251
MEEVAKSPRSPLTPLSSRSPESALSGLPPDAPVPNPPLKIPKGLFRWRPPRACVSVHRLPETFRRRVVPFVASVSECRQAGGRLKTVQRRGAGTQRGLAVRGLATDFWDGVQTPGPNSPLAVYAPKPPPETVAVSEIADATPALGVPPPPPRRSSTPSEPPPPPPQPHPPPRPSRRVLDCTERRWALQRHQTGLRRDLGMKVGPGAWRLGTSVEILPPPGSSEEHARADIAREEGLARAAICGRAVAPWLESLFCVEQPRVPPYLLDKEAKPASPRRRRRTERKVDMLAAAHARTQLAVFTGGERSRAVCRIR